MAHYEKTLEQSYIYRGKIVSLRVDKAELENGKTAAREVVEHPGGVCVLPLDEKGNVTLVRQFRYPYMEELLELPAGKRSPGEDPLECGKRELAEETGLSAARYTFLGELYPSPGYLNEVIYLYLAAELTDVGQNLDDDEFLDVCTLPLAQAVAMVMAGEIKDSKTQTALLKAYVMQEGRG
ncbi:MAG: NUDIX domain-containing protein [Acetanaerobacterium sp.]